MTTSIRQTKTFEGVIPELEVDLTFDIPTLPGSVIVVGWYIKGEGDHRLAPYELSFPVEDANIYSGWGTESDQTLSYEGDFYRGGYMFGPAQPMVPDYMKVQVIWGDIGATTDEVTAVAYEISSDLGPIIPYGNYGMLSVSPGAPINFEDWVAVYTGYNKPRPVFALAMTPGATHPYPEIVDADGSVTLDDTLATAKAAITDVNWGTDNFYNHQVQISEYGFLGYFAGFTEQSQYNTVQHIEKTGTNQLTLAEDGIPVAMHNLMILSARYKHPLENLSMEKWNLLRVTNSGSEDELTTVVWWRWQEGSNMDLITVPGSPLNLNYREVDGFPDGVRLSTFAYLDGGSGDGEYESEEWIRLHHGMASVGNFPDNDAYFYSAVAWEEEMDAVMSLPEPTVKLNKAFIDTGDGWDWFPDGVGSPAIITAMGVNEGGESSSGLFQQMTGVGAIFFNGPPPSNIVPNPGWNRTVDPNVNYVMFYMQLMLSQLQNQVDVLNAGSGGKEYLVPTLPRIEVDLDTLDPVFTVPYTCSQYVVKNGADVFPGQIMFENPGANKVVQFYLRLDLNLTPDPESNVISVTSYVQGDRIEPTGLYHITLVGAGVANTGDLDYVHVVRIS